MPTARALSGARRVLPTRVGPFDTELSAGGRDTGWFVGGTGWYRKRFSAAAVPADSHVEIVFDGVYMNSDVWLNGSQLGNHPYGYTAFAYDLTPHLTAHRRTTCWPCASATKAATAGGIPAPASTVTSG